MNLIYVESPFQLLQAVDVVTGSEKNFFVLRKNSLPANNSQMDELIKLFGIKKVLYLNLRFKWLILLYAAFFLFLSLFFNKVYIGDDNSIVFKVFRVFLPKNKIILLDDGVATFKSKYLGLYNRISIFEGVKGKRNRLMRSKVLVDSVRDKEDVNVIVGGKLVEEGICTHECYISILNAMINTFNNKNIRTIYVPHRGEHSENVRTISKKTGLEVVPNTLPIELLGYEFSVNPLNISSVLSTALFSMALIYDRAVVKVHPLKSEDIQSRKEGIEYLYSLMEENSFFNIDRGVVND